MTLTACGPIPLIVAAAAAAGAAGGGGGGSGSSSTPLPVPSPPSPTPPPAPAPPPAPPAPPPPTLPHSQPLALSSIVPQGGLVAGGTPVTIFGDGFGPSTVISIGHTNLVNQTVVSGSVITGVSPPVPWPGAEGNYPVNAVDGTQTASGLEFCYGLGIFWLNPGALPTGGGTVAITGIGFIPGSTFTVNGIPVTGVVSGGLFGEDTVFTFTAPPGSPGAVDVAVSNSIGTYVLRGGLYYGPPAITSVSPAAVPDHGGTSIAIVGSGFYQGMGVTLNGVDLSTTGAVSISTSTITAIVPPGTPGPATLQVTTSTGTASYSGPSYVQTWVPMNVGLNGGTVTKISVSGANPANAYVLVDQCGAFVTADDGATWAPIGTAGLPQAGGVASIAADPTSPGVAYAISQAGFYRSTSGAASWTLVSGPGAPYPAGSIVVDPTNSNRIYCSGGGPECVSTDGGAAFTDLAAPSTIDPGGIGCLAFAFAPSQPLTLYSTDGIVLVLSSDGGKTATFGGALPVVPRVFAVDPSSPTKLYVSDASGPGFYVSTDGGTSWSSIASLATATVASFLADPSTPGSLYFGLIGGGILHSSDGGATVSNAGAALAPVDVISLAFAGSSSKIYAGTRGGPGLYQTTDGGVTWSVRNNGITGFDVTALAIDKAGATIYAGIQGGGVYTSTNGGVTWSSTGLLVDPNVLSLATDPTLPGTVYAGTASGVYVSADSGTTWTAGSTASGAVVNVQWTLADPVRTRVYAATLAGRLFFTTDQGATWNEVTPPGGPGAITYVLGANVMEAKDGTIYFVGNGALFRSGDGGATWSNPTPALDGCQLGFTTVDPSRSSVLYAKVATGPLWVSQDGGASFQQLPYGLTGAGNYVYDTSYWTPDIVWVHPLDSTQIFSATYATPFDGEPFQFMKSPDSGVDWLLMPTVVDPVNVQVLLFDPTTPTTIYAGTTGHGVLKTVIGG